MFFNQMQSKSRSMTRKTLETIQIHGNYTIYLNNQEKKGIKKEF
jgi:hypothetical protein